MYFVDDRHIWLFQPAPPPVIPAAPWLWLVGIPASRSITSVLITGDRLPIFLLSLMCKPGCTDCPSKLCMFDSAIYPCFFKWRTRTHTQVTDLWWWYLIDQWQVDWSSMSCCMVVLTIRWLEPMSGVSSCWVVEIRTLVALITSWGPLKGLWGI